MADERPGLGFERTYGVRAVWMRALHVTSLLMVVGLGLLLWIPATNGNTHWFVTDEWAPVQVGTFVCFLAASFSSALLARQAALNDRRRLVALGYAAFAAFCCFAAGEEISWGQSFFLAIPTPEWLNHVNEQGETNVHNLVGLMELNSVFVLLFGIAGLLGTRLERSERFRPFSVPSALAPLFAIVAIMAAIESVNDFTLLGPRWAPLIGAMSEVAELLGSVGCLVYVALNGRRLHRAWRAVTHADVIEAEPELVSERLAA